MTTEVAESKAAAAQTKESKLLAIGETDARVFNCPACARPLSDGTNRCPGCGVFLILGVRVRRASAILALGMTLGVLVGGATTAAAVTLSLTEPIPSAAPLPSVAPAVVASVAPSFPVSDPARPSTALSALSGTAVVNGRIAVDAATLSSTLSKSSATTIDIARALRSLAADAALGIDLTARLGQWSEAADVQAGLDDFYRDVAQVARTGLRSSLSDDAGLRKAGAQMLAVLAGLGDIDATSRSLAVKLDLELPPVALPD